MSFEDAELASDDDLIRLAIAANPGLTYARVENGLNLGLKITRCINLWRNEECYLAGDKPRGTLEGFPLYALARGRGIATAGSKEKDGGTAR